MLYHVDTDFLITALDEPGRERDRLFQIADSDAEIQISAIAWYEYGRGPRTPEQLAVARTFFQDSGVIPFCEDLSSRSAEVFRLLGSPRRRAADIAIGVTASERGAVLLTRNERDFAGIPGLSVD